MGSYLNCTALRTLREQAGFTQKQLADRLALSDKTISKWETGRGLPDITLIEPLARALGVSVAELLAGESIVNRNRAANLLRSRWYVCPLCGNVLHSVGDAAISCCGIGLPAQESEAPDEAHAPQVEFVDGELYITMGQHPMTKDHFVSFMAYVTTDLVFMRKLYPEQAADARFAYRGSGMIYLYCNRHGLMSQRVTAPKRTSSIQRLV